MTSDEYGYLNRYKKKRFDLDIQFQDLVSASYTSNNNNLSLFLKLK